MLSGLISSPKSHLSKHKSQLSQPNLWKYSSLGSFNEYFKNHKSNDKREQRSKASTGSIISELRCQTEASTVEPIKPNHKHKTSNFSTTINSSNNKTNGSMSPKTRFSKPNTISFKSSNSKEIKHKASVERFVVDDIQKKTNCQEDLKKILYKTKKVIEDYQHKEREHQFREQEMKKEIIKLRARIELQSKQLQKYSKK